MRRSLFKRQIFGNLPYAYCHGKKKRSPASNSNSKRSAALSKSGKKYILWEKKKSKKAHFRLVPVLYERAIECAASERWGAVLETEEAHFAAAEAALRGFWEDYLRFQVGGCLIGCGAFELMSATDAGNGDATYLDQPCTKSDQKRAR